MSRAIRDSVGKWLRQPAHHLTGSGIVSKGKGPIEKCIELGLRLTWWQGGSRCAVGSEDARRAFPGPGMDHLCPRCRCLCVWSACVSIQEVLLKRNPAGSDIAAELETILKEMK
jgi:hypothetical protein